VALEERTSIYGKEVILKMKQVDWHKLQRISSCKIAPVFAVKGGVTKAAGFGNMRLMSLPEMDFGRYD
jgi:hypothetical protein